MGVAVGQRLVIKPHLQNLLAIDESCGQDCWFSVPTDGSLRRHDVTDRIIAQSRAQMINTRGPSVRFAIIEPTESSSISTIQVTLNDGYAIETCAFTSNITMGEVVAAFGKPDSLWLNYTAQVWMSVAPIVRIPYEMIYRSPEIVFVGFIDVHTSEARPRLSVDTLVEHMCTPLPNTSSAQVRPWRWPDWQGFDVELYRYEADPVFTSPDGFSIQIQP